MTFLADLDEAAARLRAFRELDVETAELPRSATELSDASVRELLVDAARLSHAVGTLQSVLAGIAAQRSARERGRGGFSAATGHRSPEQLIQQITGATRAEAVRAVRVGESLLDGADPSPATGTAQQPALWHQPLRDALLAGLLSNAQHDAIRRSLGEPPQLAGHDSEGIVEAWRAAARELATEALECCVEDLGARARALRDALDPASAEERFAARYSKRSLRWTVDPDGVNRAHITFDDEMALWVRGLLDAALRPRRGGPRFVSDAERASAEVLIADSRTNEQLAYDLFVDVVRAGALATSQDVFGSREPGVRLVTIKDAVTGAAVTRDAFGRLIAIAHSEDHGITVPGSVLERALCTSGGVSVTVDSCGNPLDVGREQRLFTTKQRIALAVRDGGCLWPGCDRPPSYCEAHHCDHWADGGYTDCDRGVLLCRFHHLGLHNGGWRITRDGRGPFVLHAPPGSGDDPIPLRSKSPLRWLWDPPPDRAGWRDAA